MRIFGRPRSRSTTFHQNSKPGLRKTLSRALNRQCRSSGWRYYHGLDVTFARVTDSALIGFVNGGRGVFTVIWSPTAGRRRLSLGFLGGDYKAIRCLKPLIQVLGLCVIGFILGAFATYKIENIGDIGIHFLVASWSWRNGHAMCILPTAKNGRLTHGPLNVALRRRRTSIDQGGHGHAQNRRHWPE